MRTFKKLLLFFTFPIWAIPLMIWVTVEDFLEYWER